MEQQQNQFSVRNIKILDVYFRERKDQNSLSITAELCKLAKYSGGGGRHEDRMDYLDQSVGSRQA